MGQRSSTCQAAVAVTNGPKKSPTHSRTHRNSRSFESNNLLALAEVASVFQAAEKTLETIQPPLSAISANLSRVVEKDETSNPKVVAEKPAPKGKPKQKAETKLANGKGKRIQQTVKREKRSVKKALATVAVDEPTYCFCNRVSFGKVGKLLVFLVYHTHNL